MHTNPTRIGVRELRANLSGLLRKVRQGSTFIVTSRGQVLGELRPPASPSTVPRKLGALKGRIWMAPDFDELPADILDAMEKG